MKFIVLRDSIELVTYISRGRNMDAIMTKRQEKSRTNYNAVLDTSIVLFNKKGYKDTTIKDICEATGLSNGSVYHLFRNKDDILRHIYERDSRRI